MTARVSNHDIDQAAADWAARLDRGALTERENAALQVWLNGDSRNQGAFLRAQAIATMSQSAQALGEGFDPGRFTAAGPGGLGPEMSPPSKMKQADPLRDPSRRKALARSEEHTSELQSLMRISYAVFCWKKKNS